MKNFLDDIRYALRTLGRTPAFTTAAALSIALGIGANTAIFTVFNAALLRPLPVREPGQLVRVVTDQGESTNFNFSWPHYQTLEESRAFDGLLAHTDVPAALRVGNSTGQVTGAAVTNNYFEVLGVSPEKGRLLHRGDDLDASLIVISHALWERLFERRDDAVGTTVQLNGQLFTVIGVATGEYDGLTRGAREEFWIPVGAYARVSGSDYINREHPEHISWLNVIGRLADGTTLPAAQARLATVDPIARELKVLGPTDQNVLRDGSRGMDGQVAELKRPLLYLTAAVSLVLLIACANVANLLLVRAAARRRDLALRVALGSSRGRLARQLLTESLVLALIAGAAGLLLAVWLSDALATYRPSGGMALVLDTTPDLKVLLFTLGISVLTGLLFGIGPALSTARTDLMSLLKLSPSGFGGSWFARHALVVVQVALSLVLLVGAALMGRTLGHLGKVDLGFTTRNALLASIDLEAGSYDPVRGRVLVDQLLERVRAQPDVIAASVATVIAPSPGGSNWSGVLPEGYTPPEGTNASFDVNVVDHEYFSTLGLPIVQGRGFNAQDAAGSTAGSTRHVAIINEETAGRYWPNQNPIGKRIWVDSIGGTAWEVIGVARNSKYRNLREDAATNVYRPLKQYFRPNLTLVLHTNGDPMRFAEPLRAELRALDPAVPLYDVRSLEQHLGLAAAQERMAARLAAGFSGLALLLSAVGLYGMLAYYVAQRRREIGVRIALGAPRGAVMKHVLARGLTLVGIGLVLGVPAAMWTTRLLGTMLYEVRTTDASSYALAALVLMTAATLAVFLPARRATAVDPMTALRGD